MRGASPTPGGRARPANGRAQAAWVSGLASWRLGDCNAASRAFQQACAARRAARASRRRLTIGRRASEQACRPSARRSSRLLQRRTPRSAGKLLRPASPAKRWAWKPSCRADPLTADDPPDRPTAQRPARDRAGPDRRAGAGRGDAPPPGQDRQSGRASCADPARQDSSTLPAAQLWLANNGQPGARSDAADRYPNPRWAPLNGWRVDPALAFGHIVQESAFRRTAVSTGRRGRPDAGAARHRAATSREPRRALLARSADRPALSISNIGQSFIEMMRGSSATARPAAAGHRLLQCRPAAGRRAGPAINDKGDPLLWIESIPYWETRYYVPAVMRNMWVYQGLNDEDTPTLKAMAEHRWPAFPTGDDPPPALDRPVVLVMFLPIGVAFAPCRSSRTTGAAQPATPPPRASTSRSGSTRANGSTRSRRSTACPGAEPPSPSSIPSRS